MTKTGTRHRFISLILTSLLGLIFTVFFAASLQAQVVSDPRIAEFDPSPDHWTVRDNGHQAVVRYELDMYVVGSSVPFATVNMGKPDPEADGKIRYDFTSAVTGMSFPGGSYEARVTAVGPEGEAPSDPSNPFTFTSSSGCTYSLNTTIVRTVASGGPYSAELSTGLTCGWTATTSLAWVTLYAASGTGGGTVPFQVQANTSEFGRTGTITIAGQALTVAQDGAPAAKTTPTLTWSAPAAITQGTPLGSTQLNAAANVPGTFAYSPSAGTVLAAGTYTLKTTFTPADTALYTTATAQTTLTVNPPPTTPVITWPAPAPITQGTALGSTQLNATASVPGTFVYNPAAGTVLAAGTYTLKTTFTPADTTRYTTATASTSLTVAAQSTTTIGPSEPPTDDSSLPIGAPYTLDVLRPSGGLVKGTNINCGTTAKACSVKMPGPMTMTLQARADRGYLFLGWTEHCSGSSSTYALALEGPRTCGAAFAPLK
jgi:hypothetical protein